jgi:hypothetical protein
MGYSVNSAVESIIDENENPLPASMDVLKLSTSTLEFMQNSISFEEQATEFKRLNEFNPKNADEYLRNFILTSRIRATPCKQIFKLTQQKWRQLRHGIENDGLEASDDSVQECKIFISKLATTLRECGDHGTVVTFSSYKTVQEIMNDFKKNLNTISKTRFRTLLQESLPDKMLLECSTCTPNISAKKIREVVPISPISEKRWGPSEESIMVDFHDIIGKLATKRRVLCDHISIVTFKEYDSKAQLYKRYEKEVICKKAKFCMDMKSFKSKLDLEFPTNIEICIKCNINDKSKANDARNHKRFMKKQRKR